MEVTYLLERDNYWAYYQSVTRRLPPWRHMDFLPLFALSALIAYDHWSPNTRNGPLLAVVTGMGFFGLLFSVTLWREKEVHLKTIELCPGAIGLHIILLHPTGCRIQRAVTETRTIWAKVTELRQNDKLMVFLLGPGFGFIVPKRAFPTPKQAQAFLETAQAFLETAQAFLETAQAYRGSALNGTAPSCRPSPSPGRPRPSAFSKDSSPFSVLC